jgi:hypothetical protein
MLVSLFRQTRARCGLREPRRPLSDRLASTSLVTIPYTRIAISIPPSTRDLIFTGVMTMPMLVSFFVAP